MADHQQGTGRREQPADSFESFPAHGLDTNCRRFEMSTLRVRCNTPSPESASPRRPALEPVREAPRAFRCNWQSPAQLRIG